MDGTEPTRLRLPRLGAVIAALAILFPPLRVPLALGCLGVLGSLAIADERVEDVVPETSPRPRPRSRGRRHSVTSTEDSFPASDPPSWTPVTGSRTRH